MITAGGVTYTYDGDGWRVEKSNGKIYWYGKNGEVLNESDLSGTMTEAYVYFDGKRIGHHNPSSQYFYYAEDFIGSSRVITTSAGTTCYDADFYPYGAESPVTNTCPQNYKWTGKERDAETGNDDFDARYYSSTYGRFLSADWSAVPVPVPYANLTNPQTLNLYAIVRDNPESYADLGGHLPDPGTPGTCGDAATGCGGTNQNAVVTIPAAKAVAEETTTEEINRVVQPLIDSAIKDAGSLASGLSKAVGAAVGVAVYLTTSPALNANENQMLEAAKQQEATQTKQSHDTPEAAPASGGAGARQGGGPVPGFTRHRLNQTISRDGVGVSNRALMDAVKNPTKVIEQSGGRTMYVGKDATVIMNSRGQVITTWANTSSGQR